ncbi:MAG: hypothetical protein GX318_07565 [Clostridia bacterium]|nr:hypothetical protein [Clostridia bacterium]
MKKEYFTPKETMDLMQRQKHDYLNHLQVIYSYLQLGKADRALGYAKEVIEEIKELEVSTYLMGREVD